MSEQKPEFKNEHTLKIACDELSVFLRKSDYDALLKAEREKAVMRCIDIGGFYADGGECKRLMTEQMLAIVHDCDV